MARSDGVSCATPAIGLTLRAQRRSRTSQGAGVSSRGVVLQLALSVELYLLALQSIRSRLARPRWKASRTSCFPHPGWCADVLYLHYLLVARPGALRDQRLAGTLMWEGSMLISAVAPSAVLLDWMRHEEREAA
jgi:cytochrome c oxidase assembly factor CtaG